MAAGTLSTKKREELLGILKERFASNMERHRGLEWADVEARLVRNSRALWALSEMERTGGEPDVIGKDKGTDEYVFCDCAVESPPGAQKHLL